MVFLATTFAYMLSFNFSINLLAMVQSTGVANASLPDVSTVEGPWMRGLIDADRIGVIAA